MASTLPLELQQQIFQYLDPRSFYASRNVCRWWKYASKDTVTLAEQLRQLPIDPPVSAKTLASTRRQALYDEAAYTLMLGMRVTVEKEGKQDLAETISGAKFALSGDRRRAVTLDDRQITLYDLTTPECIILAQRPINDLRTAIGGGPWFKCAPTSIYELGLSTDGNILAIALERTIQIYDLTAGEESWPVSSYISSAAGHYIAGLQFEHNDSLLRVQLSNKGTVVYLGTPRDSVNGLQHWHDKGGLKHAFLDSSKTVIDSSSATGVSETFAGLQLLRPFADGWLFAAQRRCSRTGSASYCIGQVASSEMDRHFMTAERHAAILVNLPSSCRVTYAPEMVHGSWQDLPSAHVQHPHFSLSADWNLLAMADNFVAPAHTGSFSRVFIFRLPDLQTLSSSLKSIRASWTDMGPNIDAPTETQDKEYVIQRLPLSIGTVAGKVFDFGFEEIQSSGSCRQYRLSTNTESSNKGWSLLET